ncbi:MAG TPA: cardiolipin synthase [Usitatibacter sp.]|nr:cardiolipin synthase [Usitatibacter sp.]
MVTLPWFEIFIGSYIVWVLLACTSLLMNRRSPTATLAWIFAFIALPVVSGFYYLVFGPRRLQRRKRRYGLARAEASKVSDYLQQSSCDEHPKLSQDAAGLAAVGRRLGQGMPTFASSVELLDDGDAKMKALETAIHAAKHHIHMEYYIWEPDSVGTRFRDLLVEAARRGVEVRVLIDDVGSPKAKPAFWKPLLEAGGAQRVFNSVGVATGRLHFANFRTHRKIAVIDGDVGFVGGINMHDPACATGCGQDAWQDQHVRIEGEPVRKMQRLFLENWTYSQGTLSLTKDNVPRFFPSAKAGGRGTAVQIIASGPDDESAPMLAYFLAAISSARRRVWIETPYLIPDEPLESALRVATLRDVDVQVIVPKQGDSKIVTMASHTYCESLGKAGIKIFEYGPPMLHAKTLVVDDTVGLVGTANMDNRSFRLNFEVAAAFYDATVIERLAQRFEKDRAFSKPFSLKRRGAMVNQMLESIARLTSPVL